MRKRADVNAILAAALSVFSEFGFGKTTLSDVAGKAGMTQSNLYLYFTNKSDLYNKTAIYALSKWQAHVAAAMEGEKEVRTRFLVMCKSAVGYLEKDAELRNLLIKDPDIFPLFPENDPYEAVNHASVAMLENILAQGIAEKKFRPVPVKRTAEDLFLIYKMLVIRAYLHAEGGLSAETAENTLNLLANGLFASPEK
ncbi:MAG: TetR/AcrR family transcriptional regulator [Thermodesulfobacteriota bacterium]